MKQSSVIRSSPPTGFGGLRIISLESRHCAETVRLIENAGGIAIAARSMREVAIDDSPAATRFAERLLRGDYNIVVCMTGVGTRYLFAAMENHHQRAELVRALAATTVVARGPKPLAALRDLGVRVSIVVPEPNTWREILTALQEAGEGIELRGAQIAVQEYGVTNQRFLDALEQTGAAVDPVEVYRWALPHDVGPLKDAIRQILARTADALLVTSATQVHHLLAVARELDEEEALRRALGELIVCSIGPVSSETIAMLDIAVDFEPSRPKLGILVREASERVPALLCGKRESLRSAQGRAVRAQPSPGGGSVDKPSPGQRLESSAFMLACRHKRVPYTPVWLMRQAGRYMQEYREVRARVPFIELCKTPELAAEVAITAQQRIGADAAIVFSDILLIVEPMGLGLEYVGGEGPNISRTVREGADVDRLREVEPHESLDFVFEAVRRTRRQLDGDVPLIGFSGAPFTLASYIVEGGGSKNYIQTKSLMYRDEGAWNEMMSIIARAVSRYLLGQIEAGVQVLQLFDSWVGCLSPADYQRYVLPHTKAVIDALPADCPVIHFGTDCCGLLDLQAATGCSVLGVDHRVGLAGVFERFPDIAVQGNLDPVALFAEPAHIIEAAGRVLAEADGRCGHIFNLGHGVLPATPVDHVIALIDAVHELSANG